MKKPKKKKGWVAPEPSSRSLRCYDGGFKMGSTLGGCWVRERGKFGSEARGRLLSLSALNFYRLFSWIVCVLLFAFTGFFLEKAGRRET